MRSPSHIQWSTYPALLLAGCLAVGIAGASTWPQVPPSAWMAGAASAATIAAVGLLWPARRMVRLAPLVWTAGAALCVVALGGTRYASTVRFPEHHVAHRAVAHTLQHPQRYVTLEGTVREPPSASARSRRVALATERMTVSGKSARKVIGGVQVTLIQSPWRPEAEPYPALRVGDRLRVTGQLACPPRRRNPADFDTGAYLRRRGLHATLAVTRAADVERIAGDAGDSRTARWRSAVAAARDYVERQIQRFVPSRDAQGVLRALLLGDRSRIDAETRDRFARTGLLHVLAVSGLHVLLVGMAFYHIVRPSLMRLGLGWTATEWTRAALTLLLLGVYAVVTGGPASVVRAVVMAAVLIGGVLAQRGTHALNALGVAALILLAVRPGQLFEAGFQLSFAAVAAIVTLVPLAERALPDSLRRGWLRQPTSLVTASLAATLGTMPVLLWHFGQMSFAGLALNLVAIPSTGLALASGLLAVLTGGWAAPVAAAFGAAASVCAQVLLWTAAAGDEMLGWMVVRAWFDSWWPVLALAGGLVALAQWSRPRLRWRWIVAAVTFAGAGVWYGIVEGAHRPRMDVLFFDVGQGDAALLSMPGGAYVLVDAGPRTPYSDHGAATVLRHLERFGIRRLDAVVITHADSDHLGGLPTLLRTVPVGRVVYNGVAASSALYGEATHVIDSLDVAYEAVQSGDTLRLDPQVQTYVLSPAGDSGDDARDNVSDNDASVALLVQYGAMRLLLTGDAEAAAEQQMVRRFGGLLAADLVKAGHHGSSTSSTPPFVRVVHEDSIAAVRAVISAGRYNPFGLPDSAVVKRWREAGASVAVTAEEGAVWFRSDGQAFVRVVWR